MVSWFDGVILILVAVVLFFELRQEAGRSMLDAVAALVALNATGHLAPALTGAFQWKPLPGTEVSPVAFGLCFVLLLGVGLLVSAVLHMRTRWSMDHYDVAFSAVFGLVLAVTVAHTVTDVTARQAILSDGRVPAYISGSLVAEEVRSFRTYHYVVNTFEEMRYQSE